MPVITVGGRVYIERGIMPADEWEQYKRAEALKIHQEIMARGGPLTDEDPQVGWDFKKNWRTAKLPPNKVFGSDYDYWNHVTLEAKRLWDQHIGNIKNDFIAEWIARQKAPWSIEFLKDVDVWENGESVGFGKPLHGPRVDFGPTADFAAFLEQWDYSKSSAPVVIPLYYGIGLMHFIARRLQEMFAGVHTIYIMPIKPEDTGSVRKTPNRNVPVQLFPIIRIVSRHYRKA